MKQAAKEAERSSEARAPQRGVDEGTKREMPTAASIERDAPRDVPAARAGKEPPPRGGEHAENGSD